MQNLFPEEKQALGAMIEDGIDFKRAIELINKKRISVMKGKITTKEQADKMEELAGKNVSLSDAFKKVEEDNKKEQYDALPTWKKPLKTGFDTTVGFLKNATKTVGNVGDFISGGRFKTADGNSWREASQEVEEVADRITGNGGASKTGEVLFDVGLGFLMPSAGPTGTSMKATIGRGAYYGGSYGLLDTVRNKGSEATIQDLVQGTAFGAAGGAVAGPIFEKVAVPTVGFLGNKAVKYGTALQRGYKYSGGVKEATKSFGKSVVRDLEKGVETISNIPGKLKNSVTSISENFENKGQSIASSLSTKINRFRKSDIQKFQKITGETPGEWAVNRGMNKVGDDAVEEAVKLYQKSMNEADKGMEAIKGTFKEKGEDYFETMLTDLTERMKSTATSKVKVKKFENMLKDYIDNGLTMSQINDVKREYAKNFKYTYMNNVSEEALKSKNLQDGVRKWQFEEAKNSGFTNLKDINKVTQGWKNYADMLAKETTGKSGNNTLSLTDWVALGGGNATNISMFLGKQIGKLDSVKRIGIKTFGKQKKPDIITANTDDILRANQGKNDTTSNIFRNRTSSVNSGRIKDTGVIKLDLNPQKLSKVLKNSLQKTTDGIKKNRLDGKKFSLEEAKTLLTNKGTPSQKRIVIGVDDSNNLILIDGRHLLEAYNVLGKTIPEKVLDFSSEKAKNILIKVLGE